MNTNSSTKIILFTLGLLLFGCPSPKPIFLPNIYLHDSPNELDKVGTVYFIDRAGAEQPLGSLPESIKIIEGLAELPTIAGTRNTNIQVIAEILALPSNIKFEKSKNVTYKMEFAKINQERLELLKVKSELEKMSFDIKNFFKGNKKIPKCYIITETYKAREANVIFTQKKSFEQSGEISKIEIGNIKDSLKIDDTRTYSLNKKFEKPLYIAKKVFGLNLSGSGLSGNVKFEINNNESGYIKKN